ncbi:hypothetical protein [Azospirillum sp. ST 5-10]|uniref:hypothetical protein n=1 Tax=unclassified Azospirillum TaxID=2630922 RepID=UPI003F4A0E4F
MPSTSWTLAFAACALALASPAAADPGAAAPTDAMILHHEATRTPDGDAAAVAVPSILHQVAPLTLEDLGADVFADTIDPGVVTLRLVLPREPIVSVLRVAPDAADDGPSSLSQAAFGCRLGSGTACRFFEQAVSSVALPLPGADGRDGGPAAETPEAGAPQRGPVGADRSGR